MLYFCIGLPRCGKSTYCNNWVKEGPNRAIVCADNIRLALHGQRFQSLAEPMVAAIKTIMIRALLDRGMDVIVDGTHTTESSIRQILEIDRNPTAIIFDTTEEECKRRADETGQSDLYPVIERMNNQLQKLQKEGIQNILVRIKESLQGPVTRL